MPYDNATRIAKRLKIFEPASIRFGKVVSRVHLLDISFGGALIHGRGAPSPGTIVTIECNGVDCAARVAWRSGEKFGIAFLRPLPAAHLTRIVTSGITQCPVQSLEMTAAALSCPPLTSSLIPRQTLRQPS